jgi:hypothetical protein
MAGSLTKFLQYWPWSAEDDGKASGKPSVELPPIRLVTPVVLHGPAHRVPWHTRFKRSFVSIVNGAPPLSHTGRTTNAVRTSKYTIYNFVIKCGRQQFNHLSNVYFFVIYMFALLGEATPLFDSPIPSVGFLLSLALVVTFTMIFEGYYDIKRHREDDRVNAFEADRLRAGDGFIERVSALCV